VSDWRRCDGCQKVRSTQEFDGGSPTCRSCSSAPANRRRAASVTRTVVPARPRAPDPTARGTVGAGDPEVRERRARRAAQDALVASHPEEFALLLRDARAQEGLRALSSGATAPGAGDPGRSG